MHTYPYFLKNRCIHWVSGTNRKHPGILLLQSDRSRRILTTSHSVLFLAFSRGEGLSHNKELLYECSGQGHNNADPIGESVCCADLQKTFLRDQGQFNETKVLLLHHWETTNFFSPFILSFLHLLTCIYIVCATSPSPTSKCPLPGRT
jgi:hypothetical protein